MDFKNNECRNRCRALLLRLMRDEKIRKRQEIYQEVIALGDFSDEILDLRFDFGQSKVENATAWAITSFTKAGILKRISKATYQITEKGLEVAELWRDKSHISEKLYKEVDLPDWANYLKNKAEIKSKEELSDNSIIENDDDEIDFEIQAKNSIKKIETEVKLELLKKLQQSEPQFFEKTVIRLLLAMGYGGKENLFEHTGQPNDGGIDGVIKQDPLGIQKIYIQAKRYADNNRIGRVDLQQFIGALSSKRNANAGVFITTSSFNTSALEFLKEIPSNILLINGQELVDLMIRYKVGIQVKEVLEICEIDQDFFE